MQDDQEFKVILNYTVNSLGYMRLNWWRMKLSYSYAFFGHLQDKRPWILEMIHLDQEAANNYPILTWGAEGYTSTMALGSNPFQKETVTQ